MAAQKKKRPGPSSAAGTSAASNSAAKSSSGGGKSEASAPEADRGQGTANAEAPVAGTATRAPKLDPKTILTRVALPLAAVWLIAAFLRNKWVYGVAGVLTALLAGVVLFALFYMRKTQRVASIVGEAKTKEDREQAIARIDKEFKKDDTAAIFAKAQLQMHEDPRAALVTLETIDLKKVMANQADEARAQRAMIHLMLNETQEARTLVDPIDLGRQQDQRGKAMIASVVCEAWARTGQAKRAKDILDLFDPEDSTLGDVRPGLLRATVFVCGALDDLKSARSAMHKLAKTDARIVAGFAQKGVHPLLVEEAKKILTRAGVLQAPQSVRRPMR